MFSLVPAVAPPERLTDYSWLQADVTTTTPPRATLTHSLLLTPVETLTRNRQILIRLPSSPPEWFPRVANTVAQLLDLPPNWDSYGAAQLDPAETGNALALLAEAMTKDTPVPTVVPTNRGGIQIEWHTRGIDLEIESLGSETFSVYFHEIASGIEEEHEVNLLASQALSQFSKYLTRLAAGGSSGDR